MVEVDGTVGDGRGTGKVAWRSYIGKKEEGENWCNEGRQSRGIEGLKRMEKETWQGTLGERGQWRRRNEARTQVIRGR